MTNDERMKILLCEDDENLGMLLREYLQAKGYDTILCSDGDMGYKEFTREKFDLCVLDVMMPKKDGFSLARDIRQLNEEVPIVFLTAKTLKEDILEGFKIGADDYLTKPFSMEELTFRIEAILRRVKGKRTVNAPSTKSVVSPSTRRNKSWHEAKNKPSSPRRKANSSAYSAPTPTKSCSATMPSRPFGLTTITSTPALWTCTSPSCVSTSVPMRTLKSSTSTVKATSS